MAESANHSWAPQETREACTKGQQPVAPPTPAASSGDVGPSKNKAKNASNYRRVSTSSQETMDDVDDRVREPKTTSVQGTSKGTSGAFNVKARLLGKFMKKRRYHPAPRIPKDDRRKGTQ